MQTGYYSEDQCKLADLEAITSNSCNAGDVPLAASIEKNIPIYHGNDLNLDSSDKRRALMAEFAHVLNQGAGVFVIRNAVTDIDAIDEATSTFNNIIAAEKAQEGGGADHFAAAGSNDRLWNSLQKLCEHSPDIHVRYFASPLVDAACEAWLGPNYQMTAQVNLVYPGGKAQQAHRDYHLGFQSADVSASYPAHVHDLSPLMTLQGAIAHGDMSIESGPTKLLPFSQQYRAGYAAWRKDEFREHFEQHYVQLPLNKGDALFFSPALFHAAGSNVSKDIHRMANLIQISSAFGRAMETIDREGMCLAAYPALADMHKNGKLSDAQFNAAIAATAEGYSFPTNLDRDPPANGLAPKSQQALLAECIKSSRSQEEFKQLLDEQSQRRLA